MTFRTLPDALKRAAQHPERGVVFVFGSSDERFISYPQLLDLARRALTVLRAHGLKRGDQLVFQVERQDEFIVAFWACLLGGIVPVPVSVGNNDEHRLKLFNVWDILESPRLLASEKVMGWIQKFAHKNGMAERYEALASATVGLEGLFADAEPAEPVQAAPDDLAFIQFSSGSTGTPKGVMLTHRNLLVNTAALADSFGSPTGEERMLSWMPLTHDMGLIGYHLTPLTRAWSHGIMDTSLFIRRPALWMNKVHQHAVTVTASPNFGFEYVVRFMDKGGYDGLDLSGLRIILNGAEPISYDLCLAFERAFKPYGLRDDAIFPGYGLAEASLAVTTVAPNVPLELEYLDRRHLREGERVRLAGPEAGVGFVCVGSPVRDMEVRIGDERGRPYPDGVIGEIQMRGANVTQGYYRNPEATARIKHEGGWTSTGDLGYLRDGKLYITGRKKDIIFVNGSNLYPHDLERVAESVPGVELGKVAVVGVDTGAGRGEIVAFLYTKERDYAAVAPLAVEMRRRINAAFNVELDHVLPTRVMPRTTSGKLQRFKLAEYYLDGVYDEARAAMAEAIRREMDREDVVMAQSRTEQMLLDLWREILGRPHIAPTDKFFEVGGTSLKAAEMAARIIDQLGLEEEFTTNTILEHPTVARLAAYLDTLLPAAPAREDAPAGSPADAPAEPVPYAVADHDVAVVGMYARFPGSETLDEFWDNLRQGRETLSSFSREELRESGLTDAEIDADSFVNASGIMAGAEFFDYKLFGYTPQEAARMSPQMRVFHQAVYAALEDANVDPDSYPGNIGLFTGATADTLWDASFLVKATNDAEEFQSFIFNTDYTSTRVSYKLGLRGPSFTFNTACSSSLVAIQLAYQSILSGDSDLAVAGGVSVLGKRGHHYEEGMIMSHDGHCRAFDQDNNGTVRGSGVGVVVLKRLRDALRDRDPIYAVVKGAGINNDGNDKMDYTAPSVEGQAAAIRRAHAMAGVSPEAISYVEAHGTGTKLGDPIEIQALCRAFDTDKRSFCALGSVKTNFGHLEIAAGVAGFIKTALMLRNRELVPMVHFQRPNPALKLESSPFYVNTAHRPWHQETGLRLAGVSSFGVGGTNAHVVLQEPPGRPHDVRAADAPARPQQLVLLSANSRSALEANEANLLAYLRRHPDTDLAQLAYTLHVGRRSLPFKKAYVCASTDELVRQLSPGTDDKEFVLSHAARGERYRVVFLFPGGGSQYVDMGRELYEHEPVFRQHVDACLACLKPAHRAEIREMLYPAAGADAAAATERLRQIRNFHPVIFAVEYALAQLLMHWGVQPDALLGHSLGEFVAATLAGVFSLEEALEVVTERGRLMQSVAEGHMMSVSLPEAELRPLLGDGLDLAAVNAPELCVVAGDKPAVEALARELETRGVKHNILPISHASHSRMMEPILGEFEDVLRQVSLGRPSLPVVSSLTGRWLSAQEATSPGYWSRQMRGTVRFADGLGTIFDQPDPLLFLEVGAGKALSTFARQHGSRREGDRMLELMRHPKDEVSDCRFLLSRVARLIFSGVPLRTEAFWNEQKLPTLHLPTYAFDRVAFEVGKSLSRSTLLQPPAAQDGEQEKVKDVGRWFYRPGWRNADLGGSPAWPYDQVLILCRHPAQQPALESLLADGSGSVLVALPGESFRHEGRRFTVRPGVADDYRRVVEQLGAEARTLVLHAWTLGNGAGSLEEQSARGFFSLVHLGNALAGRPGLAAELVVLSDRVTGAFVDDYLPEKASVLGAVRVIPQEYPQLSTRLVEIGGEEDLAGRTGALLRRELAETGSPHAVLTLFRGRRWVEHHEPLAAPGPAGTPLRRWGTYLITGATGDVGTILARHLASAYQANLVLTGRTSLEHGPAEKVAVLREKIRQLEAAGGRVLYRAADAADEAAMAAVVDEARAVFGRIHGVIHAAGVLTDDTFLPLRHLGGNAGNLLEQARAKVTGARVLARVLHAETPDFALLTSSISAFIGGQSFASYAAVNACADLTVRGLNRDGGYPWIAVNWDVWQTSMGGTDLGIATGEGGAALEHALSLLPTEQVVVSVTGLDRRIRQLRERFAAQPVAEQAAPAAGRVERPELMSEYVAPTTPTQQALVEIWQEVLGYQQIGVLDDFFELGADSLRVVAVNGRISKHFGVHIPLKVLFSSSNIARLAAYLDEAERQPEPADALISAAPVMEHYPVTSSQKRFFLLNQLDQGGLSYNMPQLIPLKVDIGTERLNEIFQAICQHHETFRTSFHLIDGEPRQRIHARSSLQVQELVVEKAELAATRQALIRPFDLSEPTPLRVAHILIAGEPREHYLFLDAHHIIFDGVSLRNLIRDIYDLYEGRPLRNPALTLKDVAVWEHRPEQAARREEKKAFWLDQFADTPPVLDLPLDRERPRKKRHRGDYLKFQLDEAETAALQQLAREHDATLFMVLLALYYVLLNRVSGQEDIVVGIPVAGRQAQPELDQVMGVFLNTLALRNRVDGRASFEQFFGQLKRNTVEAFENQDFPFDALLEELRIPRDPSRHPLFDVYFALQTHATDFEHDYLFDEAELYVEANDVAKFDLNLTGLVKDGQLHATLAYDADLFERATVEAFARVFRELVREVTRAPATSIDHLRVVPPAEAERMLRELNSATLEVPADRTVLELIWERMAAQPDAVALVHNGEELSYAELERLVTRLAARLQERGVRHGQVVAVRTGPITDWVVAILAAMRAGASYLPIDPKIPRERAAFMLADAGAVLLITDEPDFVEGPPVLDLNRDWQSGECRFQPVRCRPDDVAYVIYTSGSTGQPKGVVVPHRALLNFVSFHNEFYQLTAADRTVRWAGPAFDASVWEVFPSLAAGASIHVIDEALRLDLPALNEYFNAHGISIVFLPTQVYEQFMELENHSLRILNTGGDRLKRWKPQRYRLFNNYGPTENTVISTTMEITRDRHNLPIGRPFPNVEVYILREGSTSLQPVGIPGEIVLGGASVAAGYLNRPELTAEKFVANPFRPGETMYRTGDRARWLPDGNIEFLGRIDQQVQIRGYRVELGEIEQALLRVAGVQEAGVVYWDQKAEENLLTAYVVAPGADTEAIRKQLAEWLPYYMVPSHVVVLDRMPLTSGGKLDRKALPRPELQAAGYVAPRTPLEESLTELFARALKLETHDVSVLDNFFELGGHSLKMTVLVDLIRNELGRQISLVDAFEHASVARMAQLLESGPAAAEAVQIGAVPQQESYPVTPAQRRMYVLQQLAADTTAYNMAKAFPVSADLGRERVEHLLGRLVARHQALRTSFHQQDGELRQRIHAEARVTVGEAVLAGRTATEHLSEFVRPFDLGSAPLMRAELVREDGRHYLFLDLHHIIADGIAVEVLLDELNALHRGEALPEPGTQYAEYAVWWQQRRQTPAYHRQREFWLEHVDATLPRLALPYDHPVPAVRDYAGGYHQIEVGPELLRSLDELARREGATLSMVFLAAYFVFLQKITRSGSAIGVGIPVAARPLESLLRTVGVFVNTLPLQLPVSEEESFRAMLGRVRQSFLRALENQEYPFEELVETLQLERDSSRNPLFDVLFNFFGDSAAADDPGALLGKAELYENAQKTSKFDLSLMVFVRGDRAQVVLEYGAALFAPETIARFGDFFQHLLRGVLAAPAEPLAALSLIPAAEQQRLLTEWAHGPRLEVPATTLHEMLDRVAAVAPGAVALREGSHTMCRAELRDRANRMAAWLRDQGVQPGDLVALCMPRSSDVVVSIFGILKAGAGYLPIDPAMPAERKDYMLRDSGARLLLGPAALAEEVTASRVYDFRDIPLEGYGSASPGVEVHPAQRAYVLYTSGSTGEPKGVAVTHEAVVNQVVGLGKRLRIEPADTLLFKTPYMFDVSVTELFGWLPAGASLAVLPPEGTADQAVLHATLHEQQVTLLNFVPSVFYAYLNYLEVNQLQGAPSLRTLVFAGEALPAELLRRLRRRWAGVAVENIYGPTEITVYAAGWTVPEQPTRVLIGRPLPNYQTYVLDTHLRPLPAGIAGELYVGGVGVAQGYLNKPELTAERFIDNPFGPGRLYRTGDLVRWTADGELDYLGREDFQVKINGLRIELGDIENQLAASGQVREALVTVADVNGTSQLVAYYVGSASEQQLRTTLARKLPGYMVPAFFVPLDAMPLNSSGKTDRRKLPVPRIVGAAGEVAPASERQLEVRALFAELLRLPAAQVGLDRSFFELGGNSLQATFLLTRLQKEYGSDLSLSDVFLHPTVRGLSGLLDTRERSTLRMQRSNDDGQRLPLTRAQRRLFYLYKVDPQRLDYNLPHVFTVEELDLSRLEAAFQKLVTRHEALRVAICEDDGEAYQRVCDPEPRPLRVLDQRGRAVDECVAELVQPFDLSAGRPARLGVVRLDDGRHTVVLDMHHIVSDGVSLRIVLDELERAYDGRELGEPEIRFRDFVVWERDALLGGQRYRQQKEWWLDQLREPVPARLLPHDAVPGNRSGATGAVYRARMDAEAHAQIFRRCQAHGVTPYVYLMSGWLVLLAKLSGEAELALGTPVAGRNHPHLDSMPGMFVNTLALRFQLNDQLSVGQLLGDVQRRVSAALDRQDVHLDELVQELGCRSTDLFQTVFAYEDIRDLAFDATTKRFGVKEEPFGYESRGAKFDLTLACVRDREGLQMQLEYRRDAFRAETVAELATLYQRVLQAMVADADSLLGDIRLDEVEDDSDALAGIEFGSDFLF